MPRAIREARPVRRTRRVSAKRGTTKTNMKAKAKNSPTVSVVEGRRQAAPPDRAREAGAPRDRQNAGHASRRHAVARRRARAGRRGDAAHADRHRTARGRDRAVLGRVRLVRPRRARRFVRGRLGRWHGRSVDGHHGAGPASRPEGRPLRRHAARAPRGAADSAVARTADLVRAHSGRGADWARGGNGP